MIQIQRTRELEATPQQVWAVMGRFMHMHEFAPSLQTVDALTDIESGVGARRRCNLDNGTSFVEEVTEWEDNRMYRVRLSETGSMPVTEAHVALSVEPLGDGRCRARMAMDCQMKFGPLGWLMGQTVMKRVMGGTFEEILEGLRVRVASLDRD